MRIESSYPAPVLGVSTLAPRNRLEGQAERQVNFRSDPVNKLTRRPPMKWVKVLARNVSNNVLNHSYRRDGKEYRLLLDKDTGEIHTFINGEPSGILQTPDGYVGNNMVAQSIENTTYFVNTDKTVKMLPDIDSVVTQDEDWKIAKASYINVTAALNYSESVTVDVKSLEGDLLHTATIVIPDPVFNVFADNLRATNNVAKNLAEALNVYPVIAAAKGSTVAVTYVQETGVQLTEIVLEVTAGQGDRTVKVFNSTVESTDGIPKFALTGSRLTVKPDPNRNKGTFYLNATSVSTDDTEVVEPRPTDWGDYFNNLEEVVWTESYSPDEPYKIDNTTTPFGCIEKDGVWTIDDIAFKSREAGDNESNKLPAFIDSTITNVSYIQKRLVLLTGNTVMMSETDDPANFWRQSVVQLLVTDRVSISSSAAGIDKLAHVTPHNRDLLINASNGQFKIEGSIAITPQTASMPLTAAYECDVSVAPVSLGSTVMIPVDYGESVGIQEYSREKDKEQDYAAQITHHVVGFIKGKIELLKANTNLNVLAVKTVQDNTIYIYEQAKSEGKTLQRSWSQWQFNSSDTIIDIEFVQDRLSLICKSGDNIVLKEIDMYSKVAVGEREVYLDDIVQLQTDGNNATLPEDYDTTDVVIVRGEGTDYTMNLVDALIEGRNITLEEDIGIGYIHVGRKYTSLYRPTRPFRREEDGRVITTDPIRVSTFILDLVETNTVSMKIVSDYYNGSDQVFNSRYLGANGSILGEIPFYTGNTSFSFAQNADHAVAEFYCDNHLSCTITGLSWAGQYHQSKRRM